MVVSFFLYLIIFASFSISIFFIFDWFISSSSYKGNTSDHFNGVDFFTPGTPLFENLPERGKLLHFIEWMLNRPKSNWEYRKNKFRTVPAKRIEGDRIFVTFINHSTVLIQMKGLNIITDPVWEDRISPFSFMGPKRYREPGVKLKELPPIDVILLTHNHYDHMDIKTLRAISIKDNPKIFTSLGNSRYLKSRRIKGSKDMDWWDKEVISPEINLVSVPAQHFSGRAFSDRNKTLWCGFILETKRGNIYFAGDTGYGEFVNKIKEKYNKFLLSFIPIGAFKPEWFMKEVHTSPEDAIRIHKELKSEVSVGLHFGTFNLADDGQDEAKNIILKDVAKSVTPKVDFRVLDNGQTIMV